MKGWESRVQRFSLLLLQEGEYYFRDYNCIQLSGSNIRLEGQLKMQLVHLLRATQLKRARVPAALPQHYGGPAERRGGQPGDLRGGGLGANRHEDRE